jgi:TonB family protein
VNWQEKQRGDEQDKEFVAFLRQFRPRTPPTFRTGGLSRYVAPRRLAIAAAVLLALAIPFGLSRDKPAGQNSPHPASPSTAGAPTRALAAGGGSLRPGAPAQSGRVRVGGAIKPPIRLVNVNPVYPEEARAARVEGVVVLQIVIGEDGSVIEAVVLRSIPMLDQAAIDAVLQWVYQTTLLNGVPVEVEMNVTINFTLR